MKCTNDFDMVVFNENDISSPIIDFENSLQGLIDFGPIDKSDFETTILGAFTKKTVQFEF